MRGTSFDRACKYVGLKATNRQRRKFANKRGMAYRGSVMGLVTIPPGTIDADERRQLANAQMSRI